MNTEIISEKIKEQIEEFRNEGCDRIRAMVSPALYRALTGSEPSGRMPPPGKTSWHTIHGVPLHAVECLSGSEYSVGGGKSTPHTPKVRAMFLEAAAAAQVDDLLKSASKAK